MYNFTNGAEKWRSALEKMLNYHDFQFYPVAKGKVMVEPCEDPKDPKDLCNYDQESFKAYLSRWLGVTSQLAPVFHDRIMTTLQFSAVRAAQTCTGGSQFSPEHACGMRWWQDGFDGKGGVGPQMAALNIVSVLNADRVPPPYSNTTGGTSQGNPSLGSGDDSSRLPIFETDITKADKAGAAILTIAVMVAWCLAGWWMIK
jgi:hypothetical protein